MKIRVKNITAMLLSGIIVLLCGCNHASVGAGMQDTEALLNESNTKYTESDVELAGTAEDLCGMTKLSDGTIVVIDGYEGWMQSTDDGVTFETKQLPFTEALQQKVIYPVIAAVGEEGQLFMEYYLEEDRSTDWETEYPYFDTTAGYHWIYMDAQERVTNIEINGIEDIICNFAFDKQGNLYASGKGGIYEVDVTSGDAKLICDIGEKAIYMQCINERLFFTSEDTMYIYNLESKDYEEDSVLNDFIEAALKNSETYYIGGQSGVRFCGADTEDAIYIATRGGLYRHVLFGTVMVEIIRGNETSMCDTTLAFSGMEATNERFLIAYNNTGLKTYSIATEAESQLAGSLTIYSLEDNKAITTAISKFKKDNPNVEIIYEVGMSGEDGMTREDAIRNLNTKILSKEGPDILVLDGLPIESYENQGVLVDISAELAELNSKEGLFENITNAYQNSEGTFAVPAFYRFQLLAGADTKDITNLSSLVDRMETLSKEYPDDHIIGLGRPIEVLDCFYETSTPQWLSEDNSINRDQLIDVLTQMKKIWQVEKKTMSEKDLLIREGLETVYANYYDGADWYKNINVHMMERYINNEHILMGESKDVLTDYLVVTSYLRKMNETGNLSIFSSTGEATYVPSTVLGVCSTSDEQILAKQFVVSVLSSKVQEQSLYIGYSVNKTAMNNILGKYDAGADMGPYTYNATDEFGNEQEISLSTYWPNQEEQDDLIEMIESLKVSANTNQTIQDAFYEYGKQAINDEMSIEEAADEIINKVQIYLFE